MLEIKGINKTYKPKKGVPVKALDDISLSFDEKGLVFILGKSGSGKSTLLNVIGGLDKADSGEFVINGKSSKTFSSGDFDSYRNTFIGFIFQEYNILDEFNVGQNIALAMELQGKKATNEALDKILQEVDLPGFSLRKPNELSGGQKQRIAIARALIKDPKIIMADEPTGALDSNTGKQVFETLKKLSKDKLVIVVSHDREFAEYYGDRVIELADGKIISDITKVSSAKADKNEKVSIIDNKIMHVKNGSELTDEDFEKIRNYIRNSKSDILISVDDKANASIKQIVNISDEGEKTTFEDTNNFKKLEKTYKPEDSKFINSHLPYRNALKIGASSLKTKPLRLFFTILLSFVSFAMFGLADTFGSYNKVTTATRSIVDFNIPYASFSINKNYMSDYGYLNSSITLGDENTKAELEKETGLKLYPVYAGFETGGRTALPSVLGTGEYNSYYRPYIFGVSDIGLGPINEMGYSINGRMPTNDNEIAITQYEFEVFNYYGFGPIGDGEEVIKAGDLTSSNILGKHIKLSTITGYQYTETISDYEFEIVGIIDTKVDTKYDVIKEQTDSGSGFEDYVLYNEFSTIIDYGIHSVLFVNDGLVEKVVEDNNASKVGVTYQSYLKIRNFGENILLRGMNISSAATLSQNKDDTIIWLDANDKSLSQNDVVVNFNMLNEIQTAACDSNVRLPDKEFYDYHWDEEVNDFQKVTVNKSEDSNYFHNYQYLYYSLTNKIVELIKTDGVPQEFKNKRIEQGNENYTLEWLWYQTYATCLVNFDNWDRANGLYDDEIALGATLFLETFKDFIDEFHLVDFDDVIKLTDKENSYGPNWNGDLVSIKGFYLNNGEVNRNVARLYVSDDFMAGILSGTQSYYYGFIGAMPKETSNIRKVVQYSYNNEEKLGIVCILENQVMSSLNNINDMVVEISKIFLYIGLALAVFSGLLLSNFIAVSISNKKKEIGILRAVGAKSSDVFTIFFNESLIIALINFVLALIGAIIASFVLNDVFIGILGVSITILSFGIRQVLLMLLVSVGVALLASFIPVMLVAKRQPIDSIHDK